MTFGHKGKEVAHRRPSETRLPRLAPGCALTATDVYLALRSSQ